MTADTAKHTLAAGGLVPASTKVDKSEAVDSVVARAWKHPVLPTRTVIRLCAESVAEGDDLEMATLGFGAGENRGVVGKERKRPLGFPGWALVNDPKNARHALDVVKELKKHARKAKSKPGHAKEGFDAIATKLGKTVPHFLPSYYEEVGRVFIEHGALTYAAAMFGKARQTEAVHALEVDEQHRIDGFLEFALAGAVTTKALSEYAKELGAQREPKQAYAHFRQLCVQRTLGGMPPWSGMAKDLGRLAKAAKLDPAAEDAALIAEIIEAPALAKAAGEFWRAYAEPITALGKRSPSARGVLLDLFPTSNSPELDDVWLDLLETTGATEALVGDAPPEAQPSGGRAAWFDKLTSHLGRHWRAEGTAGRRVFDLLRRMAPRLIADKVAIKCTGRWNRIDIDLVEQALELGVTVVPDEHAHADVDAWGKQAKEAEHGRDPVRAAAHPLFGKKLRDGVASALGSEPYDSASVGKAGFLAAKRAWLEEAIGTAEKAAQPALEVALQTIENKVKSPTFAELPDLHARFAALDVAPALARTLAIGIIDEFGWPALEDAARELDPETTEKLTFHGGPPAVIVASRARAIAVGAAGRLGVHDLVIPPNYELATLRFIGGDFLVVLKQGYTVECYWATTPNDRWVVENVNVYALPTAAHHAVVLPDGGWQESGKPMRRGDRVLSIGGGLVAHDGTTAWVSQWKDGEHKWYEVSASGETGRASWPAWIEAMVDGDWRIDHGSHYFPAPGVTSSPLGTAGGFVGMRVRWRGGHANAPEHQELETIDGKKLVISRSVKPIALLEMPDGGEPRRLIHEHQYGKGTTLVIRDPSGTVEGSRVGGGDLRYCRGQVTPVSATFLHTYTARDLAGSRRLRAVTVDDARTMIERAKMIAAVPTLGDGAADPKDLPGVLPEITHPRLRAGLAGIATLAAQQQVRRSRLAADRAPGKPQAPTSFGPDDTILLAMLGGWTKRQWASGGAAWGQIERTGEVFAGDRQDRVVRDLPSSPLNWFELAVTPWSLAFLALAVGTSPEHRKAAAQLLEHFARVLPPPEKLRSIYAHGPISGETEAATPFHVRWIGGNGYAIRQWGYSGENYHILEYAPDGVFRALPKHAVQDELRGIAGSTSATELAAAVAAGKTTWNDDAPAKLAAATGMTHSEAVYLWAGCPKANENGNNFLDKELRESLGLKAAQAALARDGINLLPIEKRLAAIDEVGRAGVGVLLDPVAGVDALAAAWTKRFGKRVPIPESLITAADDELDLRGNPAEYIAMITGGAKTPELTVDGCFAFDLKGEVISVGKREPLVGQTAIANPDPRFSYTTITILTTYLPFLFAELPVGDPLRAMLPAAHELALERVKNPALWISGAHTWLDEERQKAFDRSIEAIGTEILPGLDEGHVLRRFRGGAVMRSSYRTMLALYPVEIDGKRTALDAITAQLDPHGTAIRQLDYLRGDDLRAMMARIAETPVPARGWEQNPLRAVPKLVDKVAKKLGVSRDAAALYLQYLVLLWPTPKQVQLYNGWKPKQLEEAQTALVDNDLILEAKRERAQRGHFLPGGWEALKTPFPPIESWKLRFYGERLSTGQIWGTLGRFQALAPFHLLFERAWARVEAGDKPRYEDVKGK